MKTPPVNKTLRSYVELDVEDNPPHTGELTLMFGQLAMCVNPWAGYGAKDRNLLSANEALILDATENGQGKKHGFRNLLCLYRELHNVWYRCSMDLATFMTEFARAKAREIN